MGTELALVMLYASDVAKAKAFYTDIVGLEPVPRFSSDTFAFLKFAGGTPLAIQPIASVPPGISTEPGSTSLALSVDDVDAVRADWAARGVEILTEVEDMGAGRFFVARDPDGHVLQVSQLYESVKAGRQQMGLDG